MIHFCLFLTFLSRGFSLVFCLVLAFGLVFPLSFDFVPRFPSRGTPSWLCIRRAVATDRRFRLDDLMSGEEIDKDVATRAGKRAMQYGREAATG